jgi:hypothetical protein
LLNTQTFMKLLITPDYPPFRPCFQTEQPSHAI